MKSSVYKLSEVAANEMHDYAMYTIANRAIPNMYDGLKPVQRFYLYSSIVNSPREFKKVSAVSGVVSDYGYQHGETSAAGAGQLMAATWNNNVCLVEGRGSFGTRQVQEAGAARYVYTRLHDNFHKYIKDIDLAPEHDDPEHEPPQFYVPVIPLVLANGTKGIATGFATNILPRNPDDLKAACQEYLSKGRIKSRLPVYFPDFKGTTVYDSDSDRFVCSGVFHKPSSTRLLITEIPYGYDRESYVKILDKLEEDGEIVSYEDQCSTIGFQFDVKLKQQTSAKWSHDKLVKEFKLEKAHSENLTVIDELFNLREYTDEREIIVDFCKFRLGILQRRIDARIAEFTELDRWLLVKMEFITAVLDDKIKFKGNKKDQVSAQILSSTSALETDIDRLLRLNIMTLTKEQVDELARQIAENQKVLTYWKSTTPEDQFTKDLSEL
jgi:DNA topoisomerase-2